MTDRSARRDELGHALRALDDRVDAACRDAGRRRDDVHVVVVTKYFPRSDVDLLLELGVRDLGENKAQEAQAKLVDEGALPADVRVHFVGQLQSNKAALVAGFADVVHSVDRPKIVRALAKGAGEGDDLTALIQVDLDGEDPGRGGAAPGAVIELGDQVVESGLRLGGVMAVAPRGADPAEAFARLQDLSARLREAHPEAKIVSAGMSSDLEQAIAHGATHLRVGSAILGSRQSHR